MDLSRSTRSGMAYAIGAAVVSGFAVFTNGLAIRRFDDATVYTTAKNLIAGALLITALAARQRSTDRPGARLAPATAPRLAIVALIGGSIPFVLFFEGLSRATSTNAAFIHKTLVIWVAIGAGVVLRERLTVVHVAAIGVVLAGHLVVTGGSPTSLGAGELMILAATLLWAVEVVVVKQTLSTVPSHVAAVGRMAGGSLLLLAWLGVRGDVGALLSMSTRQWAWLTLTGATLSVFVVTWYAALSLAPAVDVTAILVLGAVITGLLNTGFRDVPLTVDSYGYVLLALGAAAVAATNRLQPTEPTP